MLRMQSRLCISSCWISSVYFPDTAMSICTSKPASFLAIAYNCSLFINNSWVKFRVSNLPASMFLEGGRKKPTQTQLVHVQNIKTVTWAKDWIGNPGVLRWQCYLQRHHAACFILLLWIISIIITALLDRVHSHQKAKLNQTKSEWHDFILVQYAFVSLLRAYHHRDVQNAQFLLCCSVTRWVFRSVHACSILIAVLMVDVEKQCPILQPLLPPAHQSYVLWASWNLCKKQTYCFY